MLPQLDEASLASVPLFPLREVLFPGAQVPLHVFEPRYRQLVRDALAGSRLLSIPLLLAPPGPDEIPRIPRVAGVGAIVEHTELADGRFNILVHGLARAELEELPFDPPYRRARARLLLPTSPDGRTAERERGGLVSAATRFVALVRASEPSFEAPLPRSADLGQLSDLCARLLVLDPNERQRALELLDAGARARHVAEQILLQMLPLSSGRDDAPN